MKILFRTRGNHQQGMGDLHGTWALAEAFLKQGCEVAVLAESDREAVVFLREAGLPHIFASPRERDYTFAKEYRPNGMIFNMLRNDAGYVRGFQDWSDLIVTVDDDGPAAILADLRINPLYPVEDSLTDTSYVFLKPDFQKKNHQPRIWSETVSRILVTLGGADTHGFTPRVVKALVGVPEEIEIQVILGPAFQHESEIQEALRSLKSEQYVVERSVVDLPDKMLQADLAVCSAGLTMFEMACVGTPAVVICAEPFEEQTASNLASLGFGVNLGFGKNVHVDTIHSAVADLLKDSTRRRTMGLRGRKLVDGKGAARCVEVITRAWKNISAKLRHD